MFTMDHVPYTRGIPDETALGSLSTSQTATFTVAVPHDPQATPLTFCRTLSDFHSAPNILQHIIRYIKTANVPN